MDSNEQVAPEIEHKRGVSAGRLLLAVSSGFERDVLEVLLSAPVLFTNKQASEAAKKIVDLHTAALAKQGSPMNRNQGSPPPNRDSLEAEQLAYEIISDLHSILGSKMDGHIREIRVKIQERIANEIVALSPPEPDEQDYATAEVIDAAIAQGKRSQSLIPSLSPPADPVERAREIVRTPFPPDPDRPSDPDEYTERWLVKLTDRISAALVKERERCAEIADKVENKWLEDARNVARANDLVGGLAQSTYTNYAEVAGKIAAAIRARTSEKGK